MRLDNPIGFIFLNVAYLQVKSPFKRKSNYIHHSFLFNGLVFPGALKILDFAC